MQITGISPLFPVSGIESAYGSPFSLTMSKTLNSFNVLLVAMTLLGLFAPFSTAAPFAPSLPSGTNVTSSECCFIIEVIGAWLSGVV